VLADARGTDHGRDHHVVSNGVITELATGYDGYTGIIPKSAGTVSEILRQNGYADRLDRKEPQHADVGDQRSRSFLITGPTDLGLITSTVSTPATPASSNPFSSKTTIACLVRPDPNYHLTNDLADHAISWMQREKAIDPERPFFLYVAPGATHAPHMAPKEWIDKFKGQFDYGWDRYRELTLERPEEARRRSARHEADSTS
jgi:arylsulfatase